MNIIFMGTPDFAVPALQELISSSEHDVIAVYSQPPRPAHRGQKLRLSPVHQLAVDHTIDVFTPINFKDDEDIEIFASHKADIAIVAAYGLLLPKSILNAPKLGCLNIHSSLLPRWRGAAPIHRAIIEGDDKTGVTIMQMDQGLDTGDILNSEDVLIDNTMTAQTLHDILAELGARLTIDTLNKINKNSLSPIKQNDELATYAKKLKKEEGKIQWDDSVIIIDRKIRGLNPWPSSYFHYNSELIKVMEVEITPQSHNYQNGEVISDELLIACKDGFIQPRIIQRPGKKPMNIDAFLRGFTIPKGTILT